MRRIVLTVAATLAMAVPVTAIAATKGRAYYLERGDVAYHFGGETACAIARLPGGDGFRCKVGGDYRARHGVTVNSAEVTITQYTAF